MKDTVIYRPYQSLSWLVVMTTCVTIFAFVVAGWAFPYVEISIIFSVIGFILIWLTKVLYDSSKITICLEDRGMLIFAGKHGCCQRLLWENFPFAYYARNAKGHLHAVLSPKELDPSQVKCYVKKSGNSLRIVIDNVAVVHFDPLQNTARLKQIIDNRT